MKSTVLKRILAMFLCVMMLCSMLSVGVAASGEASPADMDVSLPVEEIPAEGAPVEETPEEEAPEEEAPAEEAPAEEAPAEEASAEETPAEETPAEEAPAEETPAEETPAEEASAADGSGGGDYDEDVHAAYVEYLYEFLLNYQENIGDILDEQIDDILTIASERDYDALVEMGLYSGEMLGVAPMTLEEFAEGGTGDDYDEDIHTAYAEYMYEFLVSAQVEENVVIEIMTAASERDYDALVEMGLYSGEMLGVAPMTLEEFAEGGTGDDNDDDVHTAYAEYMYEFLVSAQVGEYQVTEIMTLVSDRDYEALAEMGLYSGELLGVAPMTFDEFAAGSEEDSDYDTTEDLSGINQNVDVPLTAEYFPDANFRECVSRFDTNGDGKLSYAERAEVYDIWCSFESICSVRGVEYFPELREIVCEGNSLSYLNLTANTQLVLIQCGYNNLTGMNLSGLEELQMIYASGNFDLTALDVSDSAMLMDLELSGCGIEEVDLSTCPDLEIIDVSYTPIAELDISENPALTHIWVSDTDISRLDLEGKTELVGLYISGTNIPMPDIRQFPKLEFLYCAGLGITELPLEYVPKLVSLSCANNELTELNLSAVPELAMLDCSNNRLTELDVSALPNLSDLYCYGNNIAGLDIRNNPSLCMIYHDGDAYVGEDMQEYSLIAGGTMWILSADGSTVITATNAPETDGVALSVENFPELAFLEYVAAYYDGNGDGVLSAAEFYFVQEMSLEGEEFTDLTGIEYFTELRFFECIGTGVTELNLSENNKLMEVTLRYNPLETLTVGRQDSLLTLAVVGAELTELNVSGCSALMVLGVLDTPVEKLDISNCPVIAEIVNNTEPLETQGYLLWVSPDGDRGMTVDADLEIIGSRPDLTEDGAMNEEDIEVIIRHIFQVDTTLTESEELFAVADVTEDDIVDTRDATQILRHASGLPSAFDK